jgi:hypothetical protein
MGTKHLLLILIAASISGCASYFTRKQCEKTNWFQYGQKVAESGQNLENDQFILDCRKAEAQISDSALDQGFKKGREVYCHPDGAFLTGKKGEVFSTTMCDGYRIKELLIKYKAGLTEYCDEENGEPVGASGQIYKKVCPKNLEYGFLKGYKHGRKKYLQAIVEQKEDEVQDLDRQIRKLEFERQSALMDSRLSLLRTSDGDSPEVKAEAERARSEAQQDLDQLNHQIQSKESEREQTRKELRELKVELRTLE